MSAYALVDCNNFYVSCERLFNPKLEGRPVVVLSNNDGCIVARSNEAKKIGIPMGAPLHQVKHLVLQHEIVTLSSNYTLYGDLSGRVMTLLKESGFETEVYSIDEAFLKLPKDSVPAALELRAQIKKWIGIPVSIGIAPSKTLAKVMNKLAKKSASGVKSYFDESDPDALLEAFAVEDLWGIGSRQGKKLFNAGIFTAKAFRDADPIWVKRIFKTPGLRTQIELQGTPCYDLETTPRPKKSICVAKGFGTMLESFDQIRAALSSYTAIASAKLRKGGLKAQIVTVFVSTNPFSELTPQYRAGDSEVMVNPSNLTPEIMTTASKLLKKIYKEGFLYKKVGILLDGLIEEARDTPGLFVSPKSDQLKPLIACADQIQKKLGKGAIRFASEDLTKAAAAKAKSLTPKRTTRWDELLTIQI